ncbi:bifunctional HSP90 [Babesia duncani]|uniref:Bifunctional HSP90 n=1 Tax=Babesia duncani TaxID=323732 RepID=A0AAD9UPG5_9APIC|nr:bifunctional HSP90 [Babesia duncani]
MRKIFLFLSKLFILTILSNSYIVVYSHGNENVSKAEDLETEEPALDDLDLSNSGLDIDVEDAVAKEPEAKTPSEQDQLDSDVDSTVLSDEDLTGIADKAENHEYQAEVTRLLDIIVNSLYTRKDIFLRELISNAADALEKRRILSLSSDHDNEEELAIKVRTYPSLKRLSILDNGIGMTRDDLINNLGTIAKSGTSNFVDALSKGEKDANLIGQFGVGFYSAFLVADQVIVQTKHKGDKQYVWKSSAGTKYELYEDPKGNTLGEQGTLITLTLKEDAVEYLKTKKLEDLVLKYSQFVRFPIFLYKLDSTTKTIAWKHVNSVAPIWSRDRTTITEDEYNSFYEAISGQSEKPLTHIHFVAEGDVDFKALLYIPQRPPNPYFDNSTRNHNVKIYTRRVLVSEEDLPDFIPRYLFGLHGVIDSDSFPLNVSREHLQQSRMIKVIGRKVVRNVLDTLRQLMKDSKEKKEKLREELGLAGSEEARKEVETKLAEQTPFEKFYSAFRGSLKVACYEDSSNQKKISKLLLYKTWKHPKIEITLDEYVAQMQEDQKYIYFASGDSYKEIDTSPHLQAFKKRDIDVLYLMDTMDESCLIQMRNYEGKDFKSVQKGDAGFTTTEEEKALATRQTRLYRPLLDVLRKLLPDVTNVTVSQRLVDDPCAVVSSDWGMSAHMEKVIKSYVVNREDDDSVSYGGHMKSRILEINPNHPIMIELLKRSETQAEDPGFKQTIQLLYNAAKLASGFIVEDVRDLSATAYAHIGSELKVDSQATIDELLAALPEEEAPKDEENRETPKVLNLDDLEQDSSTPENEEL